jgi:hypothetical protein
MLYIRRISFLVLALSLPLVALDDATPGDDTDRTEYRHDIHIAPGQKANELTCFFCSIYIAGQVAGDVTAMGGRVVISSGGAVAGDVTAFGGNVRVEDNAQVAGDLTSFGGQVQKAEGAKVAGGTTRIPAGLFVLFLILPFFVLGALIALIVWLVQRNRRPASLPARVG